MLKVTNNYYAIVLFVCCCFCFCFVFLFVLLLFWGFFSSFFLLFFSMGMGGLFGFFHDTLISTHLHQRLYWI